MDTEMIPTQEGNGNPPNPPLLKGSKGGLDYWLTRLSEKANPWILCLFALLVLLAAHGAQSALKKRALTLQKYLQELTVHAEQGAVAASHFQALADLKSQDVSQFKTGMSTLAQSNKALFEAGLSLQEEKRLLEKQWEILTTYLTLDMMVQRIFLMRGDQPLSSFYVNYIPIKAFAGAPVTLPRVLRIVSKERFAHPERGRAEVVNGKLQWEPPQVGTSVRSNALGQYVLFTNSRLIIHGPPNNPVDHEAFPHICLGLSLEAARNLYQQSFIGTKILIPQLQRDMIQGFPIASVALDSATKQGN